MTTSRKGCVLWNCLLTILIIIFAGCTVNTDADGCTGSCDDQFYHIQINCKAYDENVTKYEIEFESTNDATLLCRFLVDLLLCVGRVAPVCLEQIIKVKESFFSSPYDCHFSEEDYSMIQQYKTCQHPTTTTLEASTPPSSTPTFQTSQRPQESKSPSTKSPSQTYDPNTKTHPVTFQTSKPTNQLQQDSNSSNKLCFSRDMLVIYVMLVALCRVQYS